MRRWLFFAMGFAFSCSLVEKEDLKKLENCPFAWEKKGLTLFFSE